MGARTVQKRYKSGGCLLVVVLIALAVYRRGNVNPTNHAAAAARTVAAHKAAARTPKTLALDLHQLEGCTLRSKPQPAPKSWTTKPIWFPAHPYSLPGTGEAFHKQLISSITGLPSGGKSFYNSNKKQKLRHCYGLTQTATCSNSHPMPQSIDPESRADRFYQQFVMVLRSPRTVLPAYSNGKHNSYGGGKGQVTQDKWREVRDTWLNNSMSDWQRVLRAWKEQKRYKKGMYLVYEQLMDPTEGPKALRRLAAILRTAGFANTAPDHDIACIWYRAIGKAKLEQYHKFGYEYEGYVPGYTSDQRDYIMGELQTLANEYSDDAELESVLMMYYADTRDNAPIDIKWTNQSETG